MCNIFLSHQEIDSICSLIGRQISSRYRFNDTPPVVIGLLNDGVPFTYELTRKINIPITLDYIQVGYVNNIISANTVTLLKDTVTDLNGRDVILVEPLIDTGFIHKYLHEYISKRYRPRSIVTVCLINKTGNRVDKINIEYVGKITDTEDFLVGFGLDYKNLYSNSDYIFAPDEIEINKMNHQQSL